MSSPQYSKFSPFMVAVKNNLRQLRIDAGNSMNKGAKLLGVSRKQLEDIETIRNYGCHIDLEILAKATIIYKVSLDRVIGDMPQDHCSVLFERPRKRLGSSTRKSA